MGVQRVDTNQKKQNGSYFFCLEILEGGVAFFATSLVEHKMKTTELLVGALLVLKHGIHYFVWCMDGP